MQKEILFYDQLNTGSNSSGFIYVLSNPAYPDWVKIGRTTRLPSYRAAELSKTTSVPTPFYVEWSRFLEADLSEIETKIHEELDEYRVNQKREFFDLSVAKAIKMVDDIIDNYFSGIFINKWYRKKQDARWGLFFELLKIPFWYIKRSMKVMDGVGFMPDFWLRDQKCFVIVSKDFLHSDVGKLLGYCFAKEKDKVLLQLWDCQPGFKHDKDGDLNSHTASYLTPEGQYGGLVEWGICNHCGSKHIGRHGSPELGDRTGRNTSKSNCKCHTADENEALLKAYRSIPVCFGETRMVNLYGIKDLPADFFDHVPTYSEMPDKESYDDERTWNWCKHESEAWLNSGLLDISDYEVYTNDETIQKKLWLLDVPIERDCSGYSSGYGDD